MQIELNNALTLICGHFGAGKTNIAIALALALKEQKENVTLIDIDIVNPYFRAADSKSILESHGIKCITPQFANTNVDIPSLSADVRSAFTGNYASNRATVFDVGGCNGAVALGQYKSDFLRCGYNMLYVVNKFRPLTATPELALEDIKEIEYYSGLSFTHIVNNCNLGKETDMDCIESGVMFSDKLSELSGLPILFDSIVENEFKFILQNKYKERNLFFFENSTKNIF